MGKIITSLKNSTQKNIHTFANAIVNLICNSQCFSALQYTKNLGNPEELDEKHTYLFAMPGFEAKQQFLKHPHLCLNKLSVYKKEKSTNCFTINVELYDEEQELYEHMSKKGKKQKCY